MDKGETWRYYINLARSVLTKATGDLREVEHYLAEAVASQGGGFIGEQRETGRLIIRCERLNRLLGQLEREWFKEGTSSMPQGGGGVG